MKKTLLFLVSLLTVVSCYDDSSLWEELRDHEERIAALETLCAQMNTNVSSLQAIVTALQENDYVTAFAPIKEGDRTIGYTITFSKAGSFTIYNGKDGQNGTDGKDGADGKDAVAPVIGVKEDADGSYYWTVDGEWLLDEDGNKVCASGKDGENGEPGQNGSTPQLKVEDGYWYVSYDGKAWTKLDTVAGTSTGLNVTVEDSYVLLTFDKDTVIRMPMVIGVPEMTVEVGIEKLVFRGKAISSSPDYMVGVFVGETEDELMERVAYEDGYTSVFGYELPEDGSFEIELDWGREECWYMPYCRANGVYSYGEVKSVVPNYADLDYEITKGVGTLTFEGTVTFGSPVDAKVFCFLADHWGYGHNMTEFSSIGDDGSFTVTFDEVIPELYGFDIGIDLGTEQNPDRYWYGGGEINMHPYYYADADLDLNAATTLSGGSFKNCHIVSEAGLYKFSAPGEKIGNDRGAAAILWESFGTSSPINRHDLIKAVRLQGDWVVFQTADTFKEGNASIAVLDARGCILWSFHIWMTDAPEGQPYYRYDPETQAFTDEVVCTMMDRNLGATSASVDDGAAAYGLLYQFNRKDPLLGSTVIDGDDATFTVAASTAAWPRLYESQDKLHLNDYADYHPTVFLGGENSWMNGLSSWSSSADPCPAGWEVPSPKSDSDQWTIWMEAGFMAFFPVRTQTHMTYIGKGDQKIVYPLTECIYDEGWDQGNVFSYYWSNDTGFMWNNSIPVVVDNPGNVAAPIRCRKI